MRYLLIASLLISLGILMLVMNWDHASDIPDPAPQGATSPEPPAVYTNTPGS